MTDISFYKQLAITTGISLVAIILCYTFLPIGDYKLLGIIGMVFFVSLSILVFHFSKKMTHSQDLNAFTRLIMYNLMMKLFISFIILFIYYKAVQPDERLFILPFIVIYLIFTIFEATFLSRQARQ
jgi:hypothetical protein